MDNLTSACGRLTIAHDCTLCYILRLKGTVGEKIMVFIEIPRSLWLKSSADVLWKRVRSQDID
jgi:hypothetical protein